MGINKIIMILATLSFSATSFAQDSMTGENKPFSIYGDFAASMSFYSNEDNGGANHDDFNLALLEMNIEKNWSKSKLHLSIGYGSTANFVNPMINVTSATDSAGDTYILGAPSQNLNLMNAYYRMQSDYGLGFWVGKFESPVGHETYNHMDNAQFTRSYGFLLAPFFSTGLGVDYGTDMWKVGLIASNGAGRDIDTTDKNKTLGLIVDLDLIENLHIDLNYVTGTESTPASQPYASNVMDASVAYAFNEMFDVAVNYVSFASQASAAGSTEEAATSMAAYVNANLGMFGLGLRYEMFSYDDGALLYNNGAAIGLGTTGTDNDISAITLAARAEIDQNTLVLLEYRMDSSDDQIWQDTEGTATDSTNTITAALMYRF